MEREAVGRKKPVDPVIDAMAEALAAGLPRPSGKPRRNETISARLVQLRPVVHPLLLAGWTWQDVVAWLRQPVGQDGRALRDKDGNPIDGIDAAVATVRRAIGTPPARLRSAPAQAQAREKRARGAGAKSWPEQPPGAPPASPRSADRQAEEAQGQQSGRAPLLEQMQRAARGMESPHQTGGVDYDRLSGKGGD